MSTQQIFSRGIYHGLPTFPDAGQYTAIVTGANGISGYYMLKALTQAPERWNKIYCLSRRPPQVPGELPPNAEHISVDFLKDPNEIADKLNENNVKADYIFFFSYVQPAARPGEPLWSNAEELCNVNNRLIKNFLDGLKIARIKPKRFLLQTGTKNYGFHLGIPKMPFEELDPRITLEPNFYYVQEDTLFHYCKEEGMGWNVSMPGPVIGAVTDSQTNGALLLAVYVSVCKKLNVPLEFPGDIGSWQAHFDMSSSMLNAYFAEWMMLTPSAENQRFNTCDSSAFTWEKFWPRLAGWYGLEWKGPDPEAKYIEISTQHNPRGYGSKGVFRMKSLLTDWAKREDVTQAWKDLAEEHGLVNKEFRDVGNFGALGFILSLAGPLMYSMDKSRKMGWHGFVDSAESYLEVFDDLAKLKMIPPVPKVKVRFN